MQRTILEHIIEEIEQYAVKNQLDHRFVGGVSFGGLVNEKTTADIFFDKRKIVLHRHNKNITFRSDKTMRDIDLIVFCREKEQVAAFNTFLKELKITYASVHFPDISVEAALYPSFGKRNSLFQFVTALEVDEKNQLFLTFDDIMQPISWQSVEPWKVLLENGLELTVRNPVADYYAYLFRSPAGPKPKDEKKIHYVKKLADTLIFLGKKQKSPTDYLSQDYYGTWEQYIKKLHTTSNPVTTVKKLWLTLYWQTIGTLLAHTLSRYANNFTGVKQ